MDKWEFMYILYQKAIKDVPPIVIQDSLTIFKNIRENSLNSKLFYICFKRWKNKLHTKPINAELAFISLIVYLFLIIK